MHITKLGHCCLMVEENGTRFMTDPGAWSTRQNEVRRVDYIFITHEHQDHCHLESIRIVIRNNPKAQVITNRSVGRHLKDAGIPYELLEHGQSGDFGAVRAEGHGEKHATIYEEYGQVQNTGYFFADRFFYPGDAFYNPQKPVEILALPVVGPWMKTAEAIEYALIVKPKGAFPVHDGMLRFGGPFHAVPARFLTAAGIRFEILAEGEPREF